MKRRKRRAQPCFVVLCHVFKLTPGRKIKTAFMVTDDTLLDNVSHSNTKLNCTCVFLSYVTKHPFTVWQCL